MADKFLHLNGGVPTEKELTTVSAGAADAGKGIALDAQGKLDVTLLPTGIGADVAVVATSENLAAGDFVNIYDATGAPAARKADASAAGKHAHGFVLEAVTSGNLAAIYFEGTNDQLSGQVAGDVFLSPTTPGQVTPTAPTGAGQVVQKLGVAVSATAVNAEIGQHYVRA